uniref:Uncharacterized protein n=1 Tax=viral metagenome TaxID=1070528 RepID=A0A6M3LT61_9ZZZZ
MFTDGDREIIRKQVERLALERIYPIICDQARAWCLEEFGEFNPIVIRENIPAFWHNYVLRN